MQLVGFDPEQSGWALVDEDQGVLRHVAGGLTAWGPRLAGGEGFWALPRTGRARRIPERLSSLRPLLGRILQLPGVKPPPAPRLAAVVGTTLAGRRNPFRSFLGYLLLDGEQSCRTLVTRDEFGDQPPSLSPGAGDCASLVERLQALDGAFGLRPADMVVLGAAQVDDDMAERLTAGNLFASQHRKSAADAWMEKRSDRFAAPRIAI
ncbi:hypothetical protein [Phenylobacterium sp.]|uniref:hypothetical protein n=1 Tax=Phenylobacterium sp. TaxID=1871053 RepID=UPI002F422346